MSSDKAGDVLLVVENPNQLTSQEEAIRTRLITLLGCSVLVHGADASIPEGINLAVVCSGSASAGLRELAVPLLACPPSGCVSVLYDLGMTMAKPDTDFGALKYSSISIRPDALYHPLAGNLSDRIKISADRELQGWAKPGAAALVVASVGGDSTRAVIFAYCQGDLMPARESVHRRAAFLPAVPDGTAPKDDLLWRLFDAIVHWTVEGGGPVAPEGGAGLWFLKDGTPTRALSTQEYRDWVHEQVSAGVWKKIGAIFSVIGVGGLITISVILITAMNRTLHEGQVEQQRNLESKLDDKMKERAKAVFVELLYQDSPISKDVRNRLEADAARTLKAQLDKEETKQKLEDLLKRHLEVEGTRKQLTETTVKALFADGKFSDVLFDSLEKHDDKDSANFEERLISLYLVAALSSAEKRKGFGEKLMRIGVNPKEHVEVRKTALELYRPTGSFPQDREDLSYLLAKLLENRKIENKKADGFMLYRVEDAYSIFVSRFSDEHASHLMSWLERNALDEPTSAALLAGLLQMRPKDENREHVGLALLIDSLENKTRRNLSILGLKELGNPKIGLDGRPRRIELSTKSRHAALRALLPRFADTPELFPTAITGTLQYPVLTQLLHSEDHDFLDQEVFSLQDGPGARAVQIILFHWIDLMIKDNRPIPNKLLDKTYSLGDALYQEGSSKVIAHSISAGDLPQIEKFFERLPRLYQGPKKSDASFQGINALRAAIVKDAAHGFKNTLSLLEALKDHPNKKDLIDDVKKQLTTHFVNQRLQQLDLPVIRDDLKPKKGADAFEAYFVPLSHAYADRAKFKMGKAAYTDARADLLQALDINPEHFEFRELLGDLLLKRKGLADAEVKEVIDAYQDAIKFYLGKDRNVRSRLYNKLGFAWLRHSKMQKEAIEAFGAAEELHELKYERARYKENVGLVHLRNKAWKSAFDNTSAVNELDKNLPWNWLVRFLAAKEDPNLESEIAATEKEWKRLSPSLTRKDLITFCDLFPELMEVHLGTTVRAGRLRKDAAKKSGPIETTFDLKLVEGKTYEFELFLGDNMYDVKFQGKELDQPKSKLFNSYERLLHTPAQSVQYRVTVSTPSTQGPIWLISREVAPKK